MKTSNSRQDFQTIATWITPGARVLDLGCGDGSLLTYLEATRGVTGYGIELDIDRVVLSVENGVNVIQGDLEAGLVEFESNSFDFVILSQTLQAMHNVEHILREMLRVGGEGIVTFPNFGYWRHRIQIVVNGRMPVSGNLPYQWYDTPNIHLCTLRDFSGLCTQCGGEILEQRVLHEGRVVTFLPNLLGSLGVFRFRRANPNRSP